MQVNMGMFYVCRWYLVPRESTTEKSGWRTESWGTPVFGGQGHEQEPAKAQTWSRRSKEGNTEGAAPEPKGKALRGGNDCMCHTVINKIRSLGVSCRRLLNPWLSAYIKRVPDKGFHSFK